MQVVAAGPQIFHVFRHGGASRGTPHEIGIRGKQETLAGPFDGLGLAGAFTHKGAARAQRSFLVHGHEVTKADEGIGHRHAAVHVQQGGETVFAQTFTEGFGHRVHGNGPRRDQFAKRFVVNEANVEMVAAMLDNGLDREMNIGLIEVGAVARIEALPLAGVDVVRGVDPQFRLLGILEGSTVGIV